MLFATALSWAQKMVVPMEQQVPLLLKILIFDRNLETRVGNEIVIGILYQERFRRSLNVKDDFINSTDHSIKNSVNNIPIKTVSIDVESNDLETVVMREKIDLFYIAPLRAFSMDKITDVSRSMRIMTLTGVPEYVEAGITVGIGLKGGRPNILINLEAAKAEGVDFSSRLLRLAQIIE